jgi:cell division protein FtsN
MPKDAPFDPCRQWLGIDAVDLGHSRLVLGVRPEESDPSVVLRAAEARLNLLRAISPGPFELARTSLIKRVEEAREKLLAEIAASPSRPVQIPVGGFAMPAPPSHLAAALPATPPPVPGRGGAWGGGDPRGDGDGFGNITIRTSVSRKKTPVAGIALALLALAAVAAGLGYYTFVIKGQRQLAGLDQRNDGKSGQESKNKKKPSQQERERERLEQEQKEHKQKEQERLEQERLEQEQKEQEQKEQERLEQELEEREQREREQKKLEEEKNQQKPDKQDPEPKETAQQLDDTLARLFAAMRSQDGEPDDDAIAELLVNASDKALDQRARKRVAGWRDLATSYKGFLDYRTQALAAVKAGDEYDVKGRKIAVVEVDDKKFKYHENGRNKMVTWDELPAGIMLAIVTQWFDETPANDLFIGAYHCAKQEPNPTLAREHWEKAQAGGADASTLIPLLDDPVFTRGMKDE